VQWDPSFSFTGAWLEDRAMTAEYCISLATYHARDLHNEGVFGHTCMSIVYSGTDKLRKTWQNMCKPERNTIWKKAMVPKA
jgi:hypothetical protein